MQHGGRRQAAGGQRLPYQVQLRLLACPQVLRKLAASLAAGQFYEAHEMFKTVYYRYRTRNQHEESYQLCQVSCVCACISVLVGGCTAGGRMGRAGSMWSWG